MNENLEKGRLGKPLPLPSKSLLTTIKLGYEIESTPESSEKCIHFVEGDSIMTTISTGFEHNDKPVPPPPQIDIGCKKAKCNNPDSIIEDVDTGFGCDNQVVVDCPKPLYKTHLCKENYLGEFKTLTEKLLARTNLGVYSIEEVDKIVSLIILTNNNFVTKKEVLNMISDLDFVDSILKSYANYQIPNSLFKL